MDIPRPLCPSGPTTNTLFTMARVCKITGAKVTSGRRIHRSGKAKKKGGIGRHVTETVKRQFKPNLLLALDTERGFLSIPLGTLPLSNSLRSFLKAVLN